MIVKSTRVKSGGGAKLGAHLTHGDKNESINVLEGDFDSLITNEMTAEMSGDTYSSRHFIISPDEPLSKEQLAEMRQMIIDEYMDGDLDGRDLALVEHVKERADGSNVAHYHMTIRERGDTDGVMSNRMSMARNEKLSRMAEFKFGHRITKGAHNKAVYEALKKEGLDDVAEFVKPLTKGPRPVGKFSTKMHKKAEANGFDDFTKVMSAVADLKDKPLSEMADSLDQIEQDNPEISFQRGDRRSVVIMKFNDIEIGKIDNALGIKGRDVDEIIKQKEEFKDGRADARPGRPDPELRNEPTRTGDDAPGTPGDDISDPGADDGYWDAVESGYEFDQTGYEPDPRDGDETGRWRKSDHDPADRDSRDPDDIAASGPSEPGSAIQDSIPDLRRDRAESEIQSRNVAKSTTNQRLHLTDEIEAAHAARQAQPVFDQLRASLAAFITPADHLQANIGAIAAQSKFDELRAALAAFITPADRLEAVIAAQDAQPAFDQLRAARMEFDGEILENEQRAVTDRNQERSEISDATSSSAIKTDENHATPVEQPGSVDTAATSTADTTSETGPVHGKSGDGGSSEPDVAAPGGGGTAFTGADVEPMPDLNDPQLMMKLSRMLAKSLAKQRTSSSGFMQNQKKKFEFLNSQKKRRSSRTENQRPVIDISDFISRRLRVLKIEDEGKKKGGFTEKQRTDLRLCMSSITTGYSDDDILRGLREHSENIKEFSEKETVDYLEDRLATGHQFLVQKAIKKAEEKGEDIDWDGIRKDENERSERVIQRAEARRHHERIQREAAEQRAELQRQKSKEDLDKIAKAASKMTRRQPKLKPRVRQDEPDDDVIDDLDLDQGYSGPRM